MWEICACVKSSQAPRRPRDENLEVARLAAGAAHMLTSPTLLEPRRFSPTLLVLGRELEAARD